MTRPLTDAHQFYLTSPNACPYLPGRLERKVFTHLAGPHATALNEVLTQGGFRRSQAIAYRPACEACALCVSVRVCVDDFKPSASMKRSLKRNGDLYATFCEAEATSEQYSLFRNYLDSRHLGGGMAHMTALDYAMMVEDCHVDGGLIEYRCGDGNPALYDEDNEGPLLACALTDILSDGLSMIYSFFDTSETRRSLGTFIILDHIERTRRLGKPYLYLGYWVDGSPKMGYKSRFLPQERLGASGWVRIEAEDS